MEPLGSVQKMSAVVHGRTKLLNLQGWASSMILCKFAALIKIRTNSS